MSKLPQQTLKDERVPDEEQFFAILDRLEAVAAIRKSIEQFERGEFRPAWQALEELRQKHLICCPPLA